MDYQRKISTETVETEIDLVLIDETTLNMETGWFQWRGAGWRTATWTTTTTTTTTRRARTASAASATATGWWRTGSSTSWTRTATASWTGASSACCAGRCGASSGPSAAPRTFRATATRTRTGASPRASGPSASASASIVGLYSRHILRLLLLLFSFSTPSSWHLPGYNRVSLAFTGFYWVIIGCYCCLGIAINSRPLLCLQGFFYYYYFFYGFFLGSYWV